MVSIKFLTLLLLTNSDVKEKWFKNIEEGKLQEMQNIYQELRTKGLERSVKKWKPKSESFEGNTSLTSATVYGHLHICKWLVRENLVDVNLKDDDGGNVLHYAVRQDRPEITRWLLEENSIDINAQTNDGYTALHLAGRNIEVTRMLLEHNPLLLKNNRGWTALDQRRMDKMDWPAWLEIEGFDEINYKIDQIINLLKTHYNIR